MNFDIRTIPKVELHNHLEGAVRLSTLKELSIQLGITGIREPLPNDIDNLQPYREYYCICEPTTNLTEFINKFWYTQAVLDSNEIIERIAFEACEDAYQNGIKLLELRYSPHFLTVSHFRERSHLTLESVHESVVRGIEKARSKYDIAVGIIGILDRSIDLTQAIQIQDFFIAHKEDFVGIDLAGDERFDAMLFKPIFENLKRHGFGVTIHAGEAGPAENIANAIELGASRIGHGVRILEDDNVVQLAKENNIVFEVCPISNVRTNSVSKYIEHPIRKMMENGLSVCINTDDLGIFDIDIIEEYNQLHKHFGFDAQLFLESNLAALRASFLDSATKNSVYQKYFLPWLDKKGQKE